MNFNPLVPRLESYEACYKAFQWQVPERFNIATAVCDRHAANTPDALALIDVKDDKSVQYWTFKQLQAYANRLANVLLNQGIKRGDRIGILVPQSIECLLTLKHPAVNLVGVVGKPDAARGEIIKAFIVPADDYNISAELITDIQNFVRTRLAAHEYPREIAFLDEMPLTVSGKIRRVDLRKLG